MEKKIYNFVFRDKKQIKNHYVLGTSLANCLIIFDDLFIDGFKTKWLVDVIEIPKEKWNIIQVQNKKDFHKTFKLLAFKYKRSRLICTEISFLEYYKYGSYYYWKVNDGCLSEICPILEKNTKIGSCNCAECKNQIKYDYENEHIKCDELNKYLKKEELKLYQK